MMEMPMNSLTDDARGSLLVLCADRVGNLNGVANTDGAEDAADQPGRRGVDGNRGGGVGAQRADHRGIDITDQSQKQLFQDSRPRQHHQDAKVAFSRNNMGRL